MYKHILYAADLHEEKSAAQQQAAQLAAALGAKLSLVHVIEPIPAYGYPGMGDLQSPLIDHARKAMAEVGDELNVAPADQHIEFGSVKAKVLAIAETLNADLIIIGSHDRHGLGRLLSSGAHAIASHAKCGVLIVPC